MTSLARRSFSRRSLSRRTVLGSALGVAAVATTGMPRAFAATPTGSAAAAPADTSPTLTVDLVNTSGAGTAYAFLTGSDPSTGRPLFLQADGHSVYSPTSPPSDGSPLAVDCAIPVTGRTTIAVPRVAGGRLWFPLDAKLTFLLNQGDPPGVVMPSAANPSDPNAAIDWGFCELTFNATELFGNISFVDLVSLPIALDLDDGQHVGGLPAGGLGRVCDALRAQAANDGFPWDALVVTDSSGQPLRAVSPNLLGGNRFAGYLDGYVDQVWSTYAAQDLTIDTQYTWGPVIGRVQGDQLTFPGVGSFAKPSTEAIFSCSLPPFTTGNDEMGNLTARLAAAFNRTSMLNASTQPSGGPFYGSARTNHYARILHEVEEGGLGYAFPYDDVHASGGVDVEGKVQSTNPGLLTVTVGRPR